jgi:hypothetical protein
VTRKTSLVPGFREGGWVIVLMLALMAIIVVWRLPGILSGLDSRALGDGKTPESYGFDLSACSVPQHLLGTAGLPRDGIQPLVHPDTLSPAEAAEIPWGGHGKGAFLIPSERVIGVEIDGHARAYPLSILNWHEVANDRLAGRDIVVVYNPLADAVTVFDPTVDGQVLEFGFSGLVYQSAALIYDRSETPSLWCPLLGRAVSGPAVGETLEPMQASLVRWEDWLERHPHTDLVAPDLTRKKLYKRKPYESYRGADSLRYPVEPELPADLRPNKTPTVVVEQGGARHVYRIESIYDQVGDGATWTTELGGLPLAFDTATSPSVFVTASPDARVVHAYRFAWYAMSPDDPTS